MEEAIFYKEWLPLPKAEFNVLAMIAEDLNVSVSTVVSAKNVLEREYENITKRKISEKIGNDTFRNLGQELTAGAWWTEI